MKRYRRNRITKDGWLIEMIRDDRNKQMRCGEKQNRSGRTRERKTESGEEG